MLSSGISTQQPYLHTHPDKTPTEKIAEAAADKVEG